METVQSKEEAIRLGFDKVVPVHTLHGGLFYMALAKEDYEASKVLGDPDVYFITYNYLLTKQYEEYFKETSEISSR